MSDYSDEDSLVTEETVEADDPIRTDDILSSGSAGTEEATSSGCLKRIWESCCKKNTEQTFTKEAGSAGTEEATSSGCLKRIWESCCKKNTGQLLVVVLGVVLLSIMVSLMVMNWAKLIFKEDLNVSKIIILSVLIAANSFGLLGTVFLLCCVSSTDDKSNQGGHKTTTFFKMKLFSLYLFGFGYVFHCGLYAWKHNCRNSEPVHALGQVYNIITIFYVFCLLVYFSRHQETNNTKKCWEKFLTLAILLSNVCIWLDTFFSESDHLFKENSNNTSSEQIITNSTVQNSTICDSTKRAENAIKKTDPFFSPAMIEFALMAIDLLFTKQHKFQEKDKSGENECTIEEMTSTKTAESPETKEEDHDSQEDYSNKLKILCLKITQLTFSFACFALFAFTFIVLLTDPLDVDFNVYVIFQLILKCFIMILILACILRIKEFRVLKFELDVESFVLIFSCFGNIVYHMFYIFAFFSETWEKKVKLEEIYFVKISLRISVSENLLSILIAGCQTYFILGMNSSGASTPALQGQNSNAGSNKLKSCCEYFFCFTENTVYYLCSILGVINLGLWISDSIGEERLPIFSINLNYAYNQSVWIVLNKIILPLTIFFRFNVGLAFFKLYLERNKFHSNENQI